MRLKFDPDMQRELETIRDRTLRIGRGARRAQIIGCAVFLAATIYIVQNLNLSDGLVIAIALAASTLCLVWIISEQTQALHASLVMVVGTIEWFEKKKLGEVEAL